MRKGKAQNDHIPTQHNNSTTSMQIVFSVCLCDFDGFGARAWLSKPNKTNLSKMHEEMAMSIATHNIK